MFYVCLLVLYVMSLYHYTTSVNVTSALANLVITRATLMPSDLGIQQLEEKNLARNQRKAMETASVTELLAILPAKQKRSVEIASEKGASSWLNALVLLYTRVLLEMLSVYAMAGNLLYYHHIAYVAPSILWSMP